jgi:hypothetical protein
LIRSENRVKKLLFKLKTELTAVPEIDINYGLSFDSSAKRDNNWLQTLSSDFENFSIKQSTSSILGEEAPERRQIKELLMERLERMECLIAKIMT